MRNLFTILLAIFFVTTSCAQQNFSINTSTDIQHQVGIIGIGSLNTEELSKINSSGKFAAYFAPWCVKLTKSESSKFKHTYFKLITYLSYNINATNNDSLLASTVLLPELGKSSFLGTLEMGLVHNRNNDSNTRFAFNVFGEFSMKSINVSHPDSSLYFNTLNYTLGMKFIATQILKIGETHIPFSLAVIPYLHWLNIPDEDNGDYRYILKDGNLPSDLRGVGSKVIIAMHDFQFFADFRHTYDKGNKISNREMKGFTSNIGVVVSASILEF